MIRITLSINVQQPKSLKCSCPKFKSAIIFAHSLAVTEQEMCFPEFLVRVEKKGNQSDPCQLVGNELPRSAGNKPSAKRKGKANDKRVSPPLQVPPQAALWLARLSAWAFSTQARTIH